MHGSFWLRQRWVVIVECGRFTRRPGPPGIECDNIRPVLVGENGAMIQVYVPYPRCIHTGRARIALAFSGVLGN